MTPVSVVLITHNEEHNLPRTLAALNWANEILVVDSFSTDRTAELAQAAGCRVLQHPFKNYGAQKNFAVNAATHNWVLALDADEVLSLPLQAEIKALLSLPAMPCNGYYIPRSFIFMGRLMRFGGEYRKKYLRFFNRQKGNFTLAEVHEKVEVSGQTGSLQAEMLHYSYHNLHDYFARFNKYTTAGAAEQFNKGKTVSPVAVFFRLPLSFFWLYVVKGLCLDGFPGFVWAVCSAFYPVVKYSKLLEMRRAGQAYPKEK